MGGTGGHAGVSPDDPAAPQTAPQAPRVPRFPASNWASSAAAKTSAAAVAASTPHDLISDRTAAVVAAMLAATDTSDPHQLRLALTAISSAVRSAAGHFTDDVRATIRQAAANIVQSALTAPVAVGAAVAAAGRGAGAADVDATFVSHVCLLLGAAWPLADSVAALAGPPAQPAGAVKGLQPGPPSAPPELRPQPSGSSPSWTDGTQSAAAGHLSTPFGPSSPPAAPFPAAPPPGLTSSPHASPPSTPPEGYQTPSIAPSPSAPPVAPMEHSGVHRRVLLAAVTAASPSPSPTAAAAPVATMASLAWLQQVISTTGQLAAALGPVAVPGGGYVAGGDGDRVFVAVAAVAVVAGAGSTSEAADNDAAGETWAFASVRAGASAIIMASSISAGRHTTRWRSRSLVEPLPREARQEEALQGGVGLADWGRRANAGVRDRSRHWTAAAGAVTRTTPGTAPILPGWAVAAAAAAAAQTVGGRATRRTAQTLGPAASPPAGAPQLAPDKDTATTSAEATVFLEGDPAAAAGGYAIGLSYLPTASAAITAAMSSSLPYGISLYGGLATLSWNQIVLGGGAASSFNASPPALDGVTNYIQLRLPAPGYDATLVGTCALYDAATNTLIDALGSHLQPGRVPAATFVSYDNVSGLVTCKLSYIGSYVVVQGSSGPEVPELSPSMPMAASFPPPPVSKSPAPAPDPVVPPLEPGSPSDGGGDDGSGDIALIITSVVALFGIVGGACGYLWLRNRSWQRSLPAPVARPQATRALAAPPQQQQQQQQQQQPQQPGTDSLSLGPNEASDAAYGPTPAAAADGAVQTAVMPRRWDSILQPRPEPVVAAALASRAPYSTPAAGAAGEVTPSGVMPRRWDSILQPRSQAVPESPPRLRRMSWAARQQGIPLVQDGQGGQDVQGGGGGDGDGPEIVPVQDVAVPESHMGGATVWYDGPGLAADRFGPGAAAGPGYRSLQDAEVGLALGMAVPQAPGIAGPAGQRVGEGDAGGLAGQSSYVSR